MANLTIDELARQVIAGKWGNGDIRKQKLAAAGYDYSTVQSKVNELMGGGKTTAPKAAAPQAPKAATPTKTPSEMTNPNQPTYQQSDNVKQAAQDLADWQKNKPGDYANPYSQQIEQLYDQIVGRPDFNYDFNADPIYQQYKDQYTQLGNLAMRDTMGQAAALTGGYGSSYASTAGQQAYDAHLQQLNNVIPELYDAAYNRYQGEGDDMLNQWGMLSQQDETEYGRYRDTVGDYYTELGTKLDTYRDTRDYEEDLRRYAEEAAFRDKDFAEQQRQFNVQIAESKRHNAEVEAVARLEAAIAAKKSGIKGEDVYKLIKKITTDEDGIKLDVTDDEIARAIWLAYGEYPDQLLAIIENYRLPSGAYLSDALWKILNGNGTSTSTWNVTRPPRDR
jgi:hypothetical protein